MRKRIGFAMRNGTSVARLVAIPGPVITNASCKTKAGEVRLRIPKLRQQTFETAIIERYRRRESSVEEALIEMYLAGVSVRRVEDITEALWGTRVSPSTVSELNKKIYGTIETWRNRPIEVEHPYVYLDGIVLKRNWAGEVRNVSLLVAIGVNSDGYREILGICEGAKEDKAGWSAFLKHLKERGLRGVQLIISDACLGLSESAAEFFPDAAWQRCIVHWYRNIFSHVPSTKVREIAPMLKAIHAGEDIVVAAREKAVRVIEKRRALRLTKAAELVDRMVPAARNAPSSLALTQHSNRVSANAGLRCGETEFSWAETKAPRRLLKSNRQIAETKCVHESPPLWGYSQRAGKSLLARDCVVGLGGLELPTKRLSAASSEH